MSDPIKLEARHVYKSYGPVAVLHDVSLTMNDGEIVALIGPSGAGKSTFLRCVNNLEILDSGTITIDGELIGYRDVGGALEELPDREAARQRAKVGMVFQNFNLFRHMTAARNISYGPIEVLRLPKAEAVRRAEALLTKVGLTGMGHRFPAQLSGGQQQRVAIARALAMEPTMMLMDEPTSALDPELRVEVANVIRSLAANRTTMLLATHDIPLARDIADRIVFMVEGRMVESGPTQKMLTEPENPRTRSFLTAMLGD